MYKITENNTMQTIIDIKVRDSGNIIEFHFINGEILEIVKWIDYSTGTPINTCTSVYHWKERGCLLELKTFEGETP